MKIVYSILRPVAERYPWLAKLYRDFRSGRRLTAEPEPTPNGFRFIGNHLMESGKFEPQETEVIKNFLKTTDVFVNVGANIGYYCCVALKQKVPTLAFEPIDLSLKYLYKNIAANGWEDNIEVFPVALSDKTGLIEIYGGGTSASLVQGWAGTPEYYRQWVPMSTMDNLIGSRLNGKQCLILVDVEGAELMMLKGASKLFDMNPKPVWIMEITITEHLPKGIHVNPNLMATFELFWGHGYQARICGSEKRHVDRCDIEAVLQTGKNVFKTHNFIFEPVAV